MDSVAAPPLREVLLNRRMLICVFTGFTSGLPLYVLISLVPAWLRSEHVNLAAIGLFTLIQFPYTWKFIWSPLLDRYALPALGRRRGWMLLTQLALLLSIGLTGRFVPPGEIWAIAGLATATAFLSASQDIVLDAYRREILSDAELGLGVAVHVNAYKISSLIPGSLSLILADHLPWELVFYVTALFMLPGIGLTLMIKEPATSANAPRTLRQAVIEPFREFIDRAGWRSACLVLAFIFLYKLGDSMATALATPFYLDMGFTKSEIGLIAKHAGLWPSVIGGLLGGLWMVKLGINRALWLFGVAQAVTILGFAALAHMPGDRVALASRDRMRSPWSWLGHGCLRGLRCAHHQPALHGHSIRPVHQPGSGSAHIHKCHDGLDRRANRLVQLLSVVHGPRHTGVYPAVVRGAVE